MPKIGEKLRWGKEQRLEFIEFRAFWEGKINRSDITARFNVSTPQASTDLALYQELAPNNLEYDASAKCYLPTTKFRPKFLKPTADRYLVELKGIEEGLKDARESWIGSLPDIDSMPVPYRVVEPKILKAVLEAIRTRRIVNVHYQSMNAARPDPQWRHISPHAFAHDSLRWHVRGYCHNENRFKDFVLSRFLDVAELEDDGEDPARDQEWSLFFDVILKPNPKFSKSQQRAIERDYRMTDGSMTMTVRYALLYYLNKRLRFDVAEEKDTPKETPVVVANKKEFEVALRKFRS